MGEVLVILVTHGMVIAEEVASNQPQRGGMKLGGGGSPRFWWDKDASRVSGDTRRASPFIFVTVHADSRKRAAGSAHHAQRRWPGSLLHRGAQPGRGHRGGRIRALPRNTTFRPWRRQ